MRRSFFRGTFKFGFVELLGFLDAGGAGAKPLHEKSEWPAVPRAALSASARGGSRKKIADSIRVLAILSFRMFLVIANFLAASAARQGARAGLAAARSHHGSGCHRHPFTTVVPLRYPDTAGLRVWYWGLRPQHPP